MSNVNQIKVLSRHAETNILQNLTIHLLKLTTLNLPLKKKVFYWTLRLFAANVKKASCQLGEIGYDWKLIETNRNQEVLVRAVTVTRILRRLLRRPNSIIYRCHPEYTKHMELLWGVATAGQQLFWNFSEIEALQAVALRIQWKHSETQRTGRCQGYWFCTWLIAIMWKNVHVQATRARFW